MLNSPNATGALAGQCAISRLSLGRFEIEDTVDMTTYGDEIYDLLPIAGTSRWPVVSNVTFLSSEAARQHLLDLTRQELAALIPPQEAFILVDQETLREEIAVGRPAIPFLERDGQYWGLPPDDSTAICELERWCREQASSSLDGRPSGASITMPSSTATCAQSSAVCCRMIVW
jgi:hypothetical protein